MSRIAIAIVIAASVTLLGYLGLLALEMAQGVVTPPIMVAGLAASVAVSLASVLICIALLIRVGSALNRQKDMLRAVDAALRDYAAHADRATRTVSEVSTQALLELDALKERVSRRRTEETPAVSTHGDAGAGNVVPLARSGRETRKQAAGADSYEAALKSAIRSDQLEISLQPIVTISSGEASGFEVFAHVQPAGHPPCDIRRLEGGLDAAERAAFERLMFREAAVTSRRDLGREGVRMPLQIAVSAALLQDGEAIDAVAETYRKHPALSRSLVLSLPIHLVNGATRRHDAAIGRLVEAGASLAVEGWRGDGRALRECAARGVGYVKLSAGRLLDREKRKPQDPSGAEICEAAAPVGVRIVATGVDADEDAVCLIDLGVDMMVGDRFSGPRRLRRAARRATGKMAE